MFCVLNNVFRTRKLVPVPLQVVRKRLSVNTCNVMSGDFLYEEGEGLEDDEVASYAAMLSRPLSSLPGGGIRHGSQVTVQDQLQHFSVELLVVHQVGPMRTSLFVYFFLQFSFVFFS